LPFFSAILLSSTFSPIISYVSADRLLTVQQSQLPDLYEASVADLQVSVMQNHDPPRLTSQQAGLDAHLFTSVDLVKASVLLL
jgi:hypothetical protein